MVPTAELVLAVARQLGAEPDDPPLPSPLRPLLRFRGRPAERTVTTVREVLDGSPEFRERVARVLEDLDDPDPVARLVVLRPDGWERELADRVTRADRDRAERDAAEEDRTAQRRLEGVESALADRDAELARRDEELTGVRRELDRERGRRVAAERDAAERLGELEDRRGDLTRAVRELGEARRELEVLHAELRALRAESVPVTDPAMDAARSTAFDDLVDALAAVDRATERLRTTLEPPAEEPPGPTGSDAADAPRRRRRRVPVAIRRGVVEGSVEGIDQLLRTPGAVVLVDGYNLTMSAWPALRPAEQRDQVVRLLTDLRSRTGAEVHVVFDGGEVGERPSVQVPLGVRTHYSPVGVEADDVLIGVVPTIPVDRPVVVVSSDRRVRDGVRRFGANLVRSAELLAWTRAAR